ncbi:hypothetical protein BAOM_2643 [Peribacillus asahii]|uniref:Integrase n=1 Tax=Peribacillus asahii TaxID=228899 RepID=A0A3T0KS38_9BACI|nr:hypothetical protein BAOM_2643 [Peribacillus asahii]
MRLESGALMKFVSERLGHATIKMIANLYLTMTTNTNGAG